jgi:hypothetical protein
MNLEHQVNTISSRKDFVVFVRSLSDSLRISLNDWENANLEGFLYALAAWVEDMDGYFENRGESPPQTPDWKLVGQMLLAARIYE